MVALILLGCAAEPGGSGPSSSSSSPTFSADIQPIVAENCVSCHADGGLAPFPLATWDDVYANREAVVDAVTARRMPPWGMDGDCRATVGDLQLPDEDLALFDDWRTAGFPQGGNATPAAPPQVTDSRPPADLVLYPEQAYTPDPLLPDDYRCRLLDQEFPETTFVSMGDALVDQLGEVHHIIVYSVPAGSLQAAADLDALDAAPGWPCFGGPGVDAAVIGGWAPGGQGRDPIEVDGGTAAVRIPAGSRILLEVHYNTTAVEQTTPDLTGFEMWTLPSGTQPDWLLWALAIADLGLDIPAGDADSVQGLTTRIPIDGRIVGSAPHMHLRGTSLRTDVIREDGTDVCLSDVAAWNFNWQRQYQYVPEDQVPLDVTDQVKISCTYDNSAANQPAGVEPAELWWGEGTGDEMCLDYLAVATPYGGGDDPAVCAGFTDCYAQCPDGDPFCFMTCATNAGEACQYCSYDALFGDCVGYDHCTQPGTSLYLCTLGCEDLDSDYAECLYDTCRDQFEAYYDCFQPVFEDGSCVSDLAGCDGMAPAN